MPFFMVRSVFERDDERANKLTKKSLCWNAVEAVGADEWPRGSLTFRPGTCLTLSPRLTLGDGCRGREDILFPCSLSVEELRLRQGQDSTLQAVESCQGNCAK
jgi:hypothetical protein